MGMKMEAARCVVRTNESVPTLDFLDFLERVAYSVIAVDRRWLITFSNDAAKREFTKRSNPLGRELWTACPALQRSAFEKPLRTAMEDRTVLTVEAPLGPCETWYEAGFYPNAGGMLLFFRDISLRKELKRTLEASERRFRAMFETLTEGVVFQNSEGHIFEANPAAERILGLPKSDIQGRGSDDRRWEAVDRNGRPLAAHEHPAMVALRSGVTVRDFVMGIYNPQSDTRRWISVDAIPQYDAGEVQPSYVFTIFSDITSQLRAEEALHKSQIHLALAQRVASLGSMVLEFRTGCWSLSDETFNLLNVDKDEFKPSLDSISSLIYEDDRSAFQEAVRITCDGVVPYPLEYRVKSPDGSLRVMYQEADLIRDEAKEITGALFTVQDVTEMRAAAQQRELLQKQLYHAQRIDALGTLAGGIAHDLNNTLVPVIGLTDALLSKLPAGSPDRPLIDIIHQAGTRARDLVRQILDFSRYQTVQFKVLHVPVFLKEALRLVRASLPTTITIVEDIGEVPPVLGDFGRLNQVILNLCANAAYAIGENKGTIVVEAALHKSHTDREYEAVRISVIDDGCGMDEETKKRIFEPFFTTKDVDKGTGLGLSVVHGIVAAHHGSISVTSTLGKGSRFDVILPAYSPIQIAAPAGNDVNG